MKHKIQSKKRRLNSGEKMIKHKRDICVFVWSASNSLTFSLSFSQRSEATKRSSQRQNFFLSFLSHFLQRFDPRPASICFFFQRSKLVFAHKMSTELAVFFVVFSSS